MTSSPGRSEQPELTANELVEIAARCERASPAPWRSMIEGRDHTSGSDFIMVGPPDARRVDIELSGATRDDQDFIACARQDVPRLLDEVRRSREVLPRPAAANVLAQQGNTAVVQLPGHRYPALAVQGDTFATLLAQFRHLHEELRKIVGPSELLFEAERVETTLTQLQHTYEDTLSAAGIELPYHR